LGVEVISGPLFDDSVAEQENQRADYRHGQAPEIEAGYISETNQGADESANKCSSYSKQYRDDKSAGIVTRHNPFSHKPSHRTKNNPRQNSHPNPFLSIGDERGKEITARRPNTERPYLTDYFSQA